SPGALQEQQEPLARVPDQRHPSEHERGDRQAQRQHDVKLAERHRRLEPTIDIDNLLVIVERPTDEITTIVVISPADVVEESWKEQRRGNQAVGGGRIGIAPEPTM